MVIPGVLSFSPGGHAGWRCSAAWPRRLNITAHNHAIPFPFRRGMTLVELLVVLTILAILSAVAVVSTDGVLGQGRFEASQRTLDNIQQAIVGPPNQRQSDGTRLVSGFVADIGRVPKFVDAVDTDPLAELWVNPNGLVPFAIRPAPSDSEVMVPCGWRGPYLHLPTGGGLLLDGWGYSLDLFQADGTPSADGQRIEIFRSRGADNAEGDSGGDYDPDLIRAVRAETGAVTAGLVDEQFDRYKASVSGRVYRRDANGDLQNPDKANGQYIVIRFFGPDPDPVPPSTGVLETSVTVDLEATNNVAAYAFSGRTIGPRAIRAYQHETLATPATKKSMVIRLMLSPGGEVKDLILQTDH